MKNNKTLRFIIIYLLSGLAFFALTMPFHKMLSVFTVSEVRPSAVLYPFLGISFGWPAALGIMTANFVSDLVNGYSLPVLFEGIIPQLLYTIVPYYLWKILMKNDDHKHRLDSVGRVLKYVLVCFAFSVLSGLGVGTIVYVNFGADFWNSLFFVLLNNFDIAVILGCPLMVLSNQIISRRSGTDRILSINEVIILVTAVLEVITMVAIGIIVYTGNKTIGTYDTWNTIYICSVFTNNLIMCLSLVSMSLVGKREKS